MSIASNIVCIFSSYNQFVNTGNFLPAFAIPIGIVESHQEPRLNVYSIDETNDKLIENYKIEHKSLNPSVIPNERLYQSDLRSILRKVCDPTGEHYEPFVGFYKKKRVNTESEIKEGDLILVLADYGSKGVDTAQEFEDLNHAQVVRVEKIRTNWLMKFLRGRYHLTSVVGGKGEFGANELVDFHYITRSDRDIMIPTYKLTPVPTEAILEREARRVRAGSPVPCDSLKMTA